MRFTPLAASIALAVLVGCSTAQEETPTSVSTPSPEPTIAASETATTQATTAANVTQMPAFESLNEAWTRIRPGDPTVCALGSEYSFWARQGASDHLMIYFEGGGGCWDAESCALSSGLYVPDVGRSATDFQIGQGIFDLDNPDNPFKDYDMVFIPVCTGDLHMGSYTRTYTDADNNELTIEHQGFTNASTVLNWVYGSIPDPESLLVAGCSAGSTGAVGHTPYIVEQYPNVPTYQIGDSLGYIFQTYLDVETKQNTLSNLAGWIPAFETMTVDELTLAQIYASEASYYPNVRFAQFNYQADDVQSAFYEALGADPANWYADLIASLDEIHGAAPNFYSYTAEGRQHCILPLREFYSTEIDGVRFRDWAAAYASGGEVPVRIAP